MNTEKTFADRLKELRNIRNYTQESPINQYNRHCLIIIE